MSLKTSFSVFYLLLLWVLDSTRAHRPSVIVIGAGPSGIAAASRLYEKGFKVTVLEAENRIGGRVHSVDFGDAYVDLGGEWCHGEVGNIVYQTVKDLGVLHHSNYHYHLYFSDRYNISEEFDTELDDLYDSIYTADGNRHQPDDVTVGAYFIRIFNDTINEKWSNDPEKYRIAVTCLETFHRYALSDEGSFSWFDVPATNDYRNCEGDLEWNWFGRGYKTILEILLHKFPKKDPKFRLEDNIYLNKEVTQIIHGEDIAVALCADGSTYAADHMIFTASLGVLKREYKTLFTPPLSPRKGQVIEELGISAVFKLMLHFPYTWWPTHTNFTGWTFVWTQKDKEMLPVEFPYGPMRHDTHWLRNIAWSYIQQKNPKVMAFFCTGEFVPDLEIMEEAVLIEGINFMLNKFFGTTYGPIPRADYLIRSNWFTNPHFRGSYSYQQTAANRHFAPSPNLALAEPVYNSRRIPRLQFGGEATHPNHYSTVHGAIEAGFREADRLIDLYKR